MARNGINWKSVIVILLLSRHTYWYDHWFQREIHNYSNYYTGIIIFTWKVSKSWKSIYEILIFIRAPTQITVNKTKWLNPSHLSDFRTFIQVIKWTLMINIYIYNTGYVIYNVRRKSSTIEILLNGHRGHLISPYWGLWGPFEISCLLDAPLKYLRT